jgi:protease-4
MNFFKTLLASLLGTFLALGLLLLVFIMIIASAVSSADSKSVSVKDSSILHLKMDQEMAERGNDKDVKFNFADFTSEQKLGLNQFVKDIEKAKNDDRIKGIFLEPAGFTAAPSTMLDVRKALEDFKASGKWIVSYSEGYSHGSYFLASVADEVYLYPEGDFDWRGLNIELMFFKNLLNKLEIEPQILRGPNNAYKSAVEPYMYDKMSPENRAQMKTYVDDIWRIMLDRISESRGIPVETLNLYADELSTYNTEALDATKLIDGKKYRDEIMAILKTKAGLETTVEDKKMNLVSLGDYHSSKSTDKKTTPSLKKDKVAVVYAVGGIESGEGDDETIGSERIAAALKAAREDEKVKAIVLRVNSPGGSALASDVIWRETQLIKQSGKPFYVSMGDYAASGGYYISCAADKIYASPNTITGSIGVFGVMANLEKFWNNKLGITFDRYETNPHADMISSSKPMDEKENEAMQNMIANVYDDFISKVAIGRNMTKAQVDSIGQGRVWSGEDAKNLGLVDELGSLQDCIKAIAANAGMEDYAVTELPTMIDPFEKLVGSLSGKTEEQTLQSVLGSNYKTYKEIKSLANMKGVQARLPFLMEIK